MRCRLFGVVDTGREQGRVEGNVSDENDVVLSFIVSVLSSVLLRVSSVAVVVSLY